MKKVRKHLTQEEFTQIKGLQAALVPVAKVVTVMARSYFTVKMIFDSTDFSDYKQRIADYSKKYVVDSKPVEKEEVSSRPNGVVVVDDLKGYSPVIPFYKTSDMVLATTLLTLGFPIEDMENSSQDSRRVFFLFKDTPELKTTINDYWSRKLLVQPKDFHMTYKTIKEMLFNREVSQ